MVIVFLLLLLLVMRMMVRMILVLLLLLLVMLMVLFLLLIVILLLLLLRMLQVLLQMRLEMGKVKGLDGDDTCWDRGRRSEEGALGRVGGGRGLGVEGDERGLLRLGLREELEGGGVGVGLHGEAVEEGRGELDDGLDGGDLGGAREARALAVVLERVRGRVREVERRGRRLREDALDLALLAERAHVHVEAAQLRKVRRARRHRPVHARDEAQHPRRPAARRRERDAPRRHHRPRVERHRRVVPQPFLQHPLHRRPVRLRHAHHQQHRQQRQRPQPRRPLARPRALHVAHRAPGISLPVAVALTVALTAVSTAAAIVVPRLGVVGAVVVQHERKVVADGRTALQDARAVVHALHGELDQLEARLVARLGALG